MTPGPSERSLLEEYVNRYLWVDEEWLESDSASATYWQSRLAQTTTVRLLDADRARWQVDTLVVRDVTDLEKAYESCLLLNGFTLGWSFAVDPARREIRAIAAMTAPTTWDAWMLRLSEVAKLSSWFSDVAADALAAAVKGEVAISNPAEKPGPRSMPDGTYFYLEALRSRPEWVSNRTSRLYPPIHMIAARFIEGVGPDADRVAIGDCSFTIECTDDETAEAVVFEFENSFLTHWIGGAGWSSSYIFPGYFAERALPQLASELAWHMYEDDESNLLGGWCSIEGALAFHQFTTMSELRHYEQFPSFTGHNANVLWSLSSAGTMCIPTAQQARATSDDVHEPSADGSGIAEDDRMELSRVLFGAFTSSFCDAVEMSEVGADSADRRLLWRPNPTVIATVGWVNPAGPTLATLELATCIRSGREYLINYFRHPFSPTYEVIGELDESTDQAELLADGLRALFSAPPTFFDLSDCPDEVKGFIETVLRQMVSRLVAESDDVDLITETARIIDAQGDVWRLLEAEVSSDVLSIAAQLRAAAGDDGVDAWFGWASSPEHVEAMYSQLPDVWDDSVTLAKLKGADLRAFDMPPLVINYRPQPGR